MISEELVDYKIGLLQFMQGIGKYSSYYPFITQV